MGSDYFIRDVEQSLLATLPESTKRMSRLDVYLKEGTRVVVKGYGKPFANYGHPSHGWMNHNEPIVGNSTLIDIIEQRNFSFVLPGPFRYPYGEEHSWSLERYDEQLPRNRGPQFVPAFSFDNDNEHLAAMTQSQVQDVMWIHKAAQDIAAIRLRAYFISANESAQSDEFYAIVLLDDDFMLRFKDTWQHLVKDEFLQLKMFDGSNDETPASWDAMIMDHPRGLTAMAGHRADKDDFVLRVRRPQQKQPQRRPEFNVSVFRDRRTANSWFEWDQDNWNSVSLEFNPHLKECKRNVDAVCMFHPQAQPSNLAAVPQDVGFRMALHRALLRGNGFYDILVRGTDDGPYEVDNLASDFEHAHLGESRAPRSLPVVNLLNLDHDHLTALLQDILPEDRQRFYNYMTERPLGLGCISAGPGFGKTTVISVATIGMNATLGKIYAVAPSHVAIDTFAERLARTSQNVAARCNRDKERGDRLRKRRVLVLRGYRFGDEYDAFMSLLRNPRSGDTAAFWLLMVLRSPAQMQRDMDTRPEFGRLCDMATGRITWEEYQHGERISQGFVTGMFLHLVKQADILCTTPALSCTLPYRTWKEESARGIAVDEAGNISRPDLYSAWGNTLLPCLLSGDEKQLRPNIMTMNDQDANTNAINRFAPDGLISPLEFFASTGWPIYRLRVQLRMARGLFDMCHREVYSDLPFTYGVGSNLARHGVGVTLENYLVRRFPDLVPPPAGMLNEVFVHCLGTVCSVHGLTKSKRNEDQVDNALDFLRDFVQTTAVDASRLAIITPYKANVDYIARRRRGPRYAILADMRPAATVDSSQGSEADIIVAIFGTTSAVGPGFTTDEHRLNVMLSRQKSGLLIFGDINVLGNVNEPMRGKKTVLLNLFQHLPIECLSRKTTTNDQFAPYHDYNSSNTSRICH
ncbi:P-loop containing nucleoside triphosphate hydrolase protein [Trichoderma pleuroticola]